MIWKRIKYYFSEIAFTENWRAIIGVFTFVEIEDKVDTKYDFFLSDL